MQNRDQFREEGLGSSGPPGRLVGEAGLRVRGESLSIGDAAVDGLLVLGGGQVGDTVVAWLADRRDDLVGAGECLDELGSAGSWACCGRPSKRRPSCVCARRLRLTVSRSTWISSGASASWAEGASAVVIG